MDQDYRVEDFSVEDFDDPLALLEAMKRAKQSSDNNGKIMVKQIDSKLLTVSDIISRYNVSKDMIDIAIGNGKIKVEKYEPLIAKEEIEKYLSEITQENNVVQTFIDDIKNMRVFYSYKPLFILAVLDQANKDGEVFLDSIVSYFLDYYSKRKNEGIIEKPDSTFVKYYGDYKKAEKTIIVYPLTIFEKKGFVKFIKEQRLVVINKSIWDHLSDTVKSDLYSSCLSHLSKYYNGLKS